MRNPPEISAGMPALADSQAQLAAALAARTNPPPGFDAAGVSRAGAAVAAKRAAAAAKLLPAVWRSLGAGAGGAFRAYLAAHPFPGDHAADALAFAAGVCTRHSPPAAVHEVLSLRVGYGWPVRVARAPRRVFVMARIGKRPRCLALPWF